MLEFSAKNPNGYTTTNSVRYTKNLHKRLQVLYKRCLKQNVCEVDLIENILDGSVERYFCNNKANINEIKNAIEHTGKQISRLRQAKYDQVHCSLPNVMRTSNKELERIYDFVINNAKLHGYTRVNVQDSIVICDGFKSLTFHADRLPIFNHLVGQVKQKQCDEYINEIKNAGVGELGEFLEETATIQPMFCTSNGKIYFVFSHTSLIYDYILEVKF